MRWLVALFYCTKKVRDALAKVELLVPPTSDAPDHWYCHLFVLARSKSLIFMHAQTLFSFVVPSVRVSDLRRLADLFRRHLRAELAREGFEPDVAQQLGADSPPLFCPTADRHLIGSMNDHITTVSFHARHDGVLTDQELPAANAALNRTPMSVLGMASARVRLAAALGLGSS